MPFCPFWGEGSPTKIDCRKKVGELILTSLEDLVFLWALRLVAPDVFSTCREAPMDRCKELLESLSRELEPGPRAVGRGTRCGSGLGLPCKEGGSQKEPDLRKKRRNKERKSTRHSQSLLAFQLTWNRSTFRGALAWTRFLLKGPSPERQLPCYLVGKGNKAARKSHSTKHISHVKKPLHLLPFAPGYVSGQSGLAILQK